MTCKKKRSLFGFDEKVTFDGSHVGSIDSLLVSFPTFQTSSQPPSSNNPWKKPPNFSTPTKESFLEGFNCKSSPKKKSLKQKKKSEEKTKPEKQKGSFMVWSK